MLSLNGLIKIRFPAIALLLFLFLPGKSLCQENILDSALTFKSGLVRTGNALEIISKQTGYYFTYDTRLINSDKKVELNFRDTDLKTILKNIVNNDSLVFSVIDKYIIISKQQPSLGAPVSESRSPVSSITGIVTDEETGEALPFATIGIKYSHKGTVSNNNGEFGLNLTPDVYDDTLFISYIGYISREIPVQQTMGSRMMISMEREFISIPEIIIRNQIPQEIIQKTRRAIPVNYGTTPVIMTGFYREGVMKKNELQTYSEAVLQIFKSSYGPTLAGDQVKVYKSRKIENLDLSDTLAVRLKAGLSSSLELDVARNIFDFISAMGIEDYNYRMTDIVKYDDESAYVIEFEQKNHVEDPLFKGTLYINTSDFGIFKAEFEINPKYIHKIKESYVSSSSKGFNTWLTSVKYSVSYRKNDNRYYLSHVRGDLNFTSKQRRKLFNSQFHVFFELAITDTRLENVKRFEREDLAPVHSIFSKTITSYDPDFWENQDFLRPEENLLQALKNIKVRLQEFSENK